MYFLETYGLLGDVNMAIDTAIGEILGGISSYSHYSQGNFDNVMLRFYTWKVPTLSLGKHQKIEDIDWDFLEKNGFDAVRRPSGGRAVLHWDELTYSFIVPKGHELFSTTVLELYNLISSLIVDGLRNLGYPVEIVDGKGKTISHVCFQAPSAYEIVLNGIKVVGSAQMRTQDYILQHGSIVLLPHDEIKYCFKNTKHLDISLIGLYDYKIIPFQDVANSLKKSFEVYFGKSESFPYEDSLKCMADNLSKNFKINKKN